jgi:branched-chain amino acid transport system substrate-binding protein
MVHILEQAGDDLTRENVLKQAASMKDVTLPLFLPGMAMNTTRRPIISRLNRCS